MIYVDEAGTGGEPVTVVAAVLIDVDLQWQDVYQHLRDLAARFFPEMKPIDVIFHVKDIHNGSGIFAGKSLEQRRGMIEAVVALPRAYRLPVSIGWAHTTYEGRPEYRKPLERKLASHKVAYMQALVAAERYMREFAREGELASVVAEHVPEAKNLLNAVQWTLQQRDPSESGLPQHMKEFLPVTRIIHSIHFASKASTPLLQIADACAAVAARYLAHRKGSDAMFNLMVGGAQTDTNAPSGYFTVSEKPKPNFRPRGPFLTWGAEE